MAGAVPQLLPVCLHAGERPVAHPLPGSLPAQPGSSCPAGKPLHRTKSLSFPPSMPTGYVWLETSLIT